MGSEAMTCAAATVPRGFTVTGGLTRNRAFARQLSIMIAVAVVAAAAAGAARKHRPAEAMSKAGSRECGVMVLRVG